MMDTVLDNTMDNSSNSAYRDDPNGSPESFEDDYNQEEEATTVPTNINAQRRRITLSFVAVTALILVISFSIPRSKGSTNSKSDAASSLAADNLDAAGDDSGKIFSDVDKIGSMMSEDPTAAPVDHHKHHNKDTKEKLSNVASSTNTEEPETDAPTSATETAEPTNLRAPIAAPIASPTKAPVKSSSRPMITDTPVSEFIAQGCLGTDRFNNENMETHSKLFPGQFICSKDNDHRYQFGLSTNGDLLFQDIQDNKVESIFENPYSGIKSNNQTETGLYTSYLSLQTDGTMVMHRAKSGHPNQNKYNTVMWTATPIYNMTLTEKCLPNHDCPYLHLHKDGVMVVNWIDGDSVANDWESRNFLKVYGL